MTRHVCTHLKEEPAAGFSVLLVDDSLSIRHFLSVSLGAAGYATAVAEDGMSAYEKAKREHFDLVITDQNMPRMNGVELIRELRALPDYARVPILVFSIETSEELKRVAKESGASGWMVKPIASTQIVDLATRLLRSRLVS